MTKAEELGFSSRFWTSYEIDALREEVKNLRMVAHVADKARAEEARLSESMRRVNAITEAAMSSWRWEGMVDAIREIHAITFKVDDRYRVG